MNEDKRLSWLSLQLRRGTDGKRVPADGFAFSEAADTPSKLERVHPQTVRATLIDSRDRMVACIYLSEKFLVEALRALGGPEVKYSREEDVTEAALRFTAERYMADQINGIDRRRGRT